MAVRPHAREHAAARGVADTVGSGQERVVVIARASIEGRGSGRRVLLQNFSASRGLRRTHFVQTVKGLDTTRTLGVVSAPVLTMVGWARGVGTART